MTSGVAGLWRNMLRVSHVGLVCAYIVCPPGRGSAASLARARGGVGKALAQAQSENRVQQGGLPFAGQTVEPFTMAIIVFWKGWVGCPPGGF